MLPSWACAPQNPPSWRWMVPAPTAEAGREAGGFLAGEVRGRSTLDQCWKVGLILRRSGVSGGIWGCTLFPKAEVG